jgi:GTP-binding protein HflX
LSQEKKAGKANILSFRTFVIGPYLKDQEASLLPTLLEEAVGLACAIDLPVILTKVFQLKRLDPATFIRQGAVEECLQLIQDHSIELVILDTALSPIQQRNLEKIFQCKVIDRTALILEIFGARARTSEGRLQVELAALTYQRSRLVRSWTHLERQRGGLGFMGGPGESQLELDRRMIDDKIVKLKKELAKVVKTRHLHRQARQRVPYPIVALVGYTNAGKSTLFNQLAHEKVYAENQLFATLDPTLRQVRLPSGKYILLSDTVGFISHLPTSLIAAFRATLEEVTCADLIIHVRDISHPQTQHQKEAVHQVLKELGMDLSQEKGCIEVYNKIDLLTPEEEEDLLKRSIAQPSSFVPLSAAHNLNVSSLLKEMDAFFQQGEKVFSLKISLEDGASLAWLYRYGSVLERRDDAQFAYVRVRLAPAGFGKLQRQRRDHHPSQKERLSEAWEEPEEDQDKQAEA